MNETIKYVEWILNQNEGGCSLSTIMEGLNEIAQETGIMMLSEVDLLLLLDQTFHIDYIKYGCNKVFIYIV